MTCRQRNIPAFFVEKDVMQEEDRSLSEVVPLLVAALVCDVAVEDPSTGKKSLIGIFNKVHASNFPTSRTISLYCKIVDAEGFYNLDVRYIQVGTSKVLAQTKGGLTVQDRLGSTDMHISFPNLQIPTMGMYEFQIWANAMFLGSTSIEAVLLGV